METIAVTINKGGPNPRKRTELANFILGGPYPLADLVRGTESASGFGPGDRIRGGEQIILELMRKILESGKLNRILSIKS